MTPTMRRRLARAATPAAAALVLAGCGGAASTTPPASGSAGSAATSGCGVAQSITVTGSTVTPPPSTLDVKAGCEVRLTVTADRTSQVHVHVVDIEKPITAGTPTTIDFTPTQQGVYEVELHDPDLLLVKLAVR